MAKRAPLTNLTGHLNKKASDTPAPAAAPVTTGEIQGSAPARRKSQPDGRKGILVRARPEAWKALKQVALDGETTLQDLMIEAINDVLQKHGKPPIA